MNANENFRYVNCNTLHSWASEDIYEIAKFFSEVFSAKAPSETESEPLDVSDWHVTLPDSSMTTDELSERLTGKKAPEGLTLADVFKPKSRGALLRSGSVMPDLGRGDVLRILAQMESALSEKA
jgi:hypothetical protein